VDFRWVIGITVWTFLSGPIFSGPRHLPPARAQPSALNPAHRVSSGAAKALPAPPRDGPEKK
jgi:hypothetical protein